MKVQVSQLEIGNLFQFGQDVYTVVNDELHKEGAIDVRRVASVHEGNVTKVRIDWQEVQRFNAYAMVQRVRFETKLVEV